MAWFKVDDKFHSHPKAMAAGNAAIGLWTLCGSWCSDQLTDGLIPSGIARRYGTRKEIAALLNVGLWTEADGGYTMHDFDDYNPLAEQVTAQREAAAKRQRRGRQTQKSRRDSQRDGPDMSHRDSQRSHSVSHGGPDPSRSSGFHAQDPITGVDAKPGDNSRNGDKEPAPIDSLLGRIDLP